MSKSIESFLQLLRESPDGTLFNPWYDNDTEHDLNRKAPSVRLNQLKTYLTDRLHTAKYICIGEALGYQGGHFTGIAMTSERILLGHQKKKHGIPPDVVFRTKEGQRTSDPDIQEKGFSEPTATIMWKALLELEIDPFEVILWNALPWHPFESESNPLSNRTPTSDEFEEALPILDQFLQLFGDQQIIAVGRKAERYLQQLSHSFVHVRHPAHGGAPKFRKQMKALVDES